MVLCVATGPALHITSFSTTSPSLHIMVATMQTGIVFWHIRYHYAWLTNWFEFYSTLSFWSIQHIPVTVMHWISSTLWHRWPVAVTKEKFWHLVRPQIPVLHAFLWWILAAKGHKRQKMQKRTEMANFWAKFRILALSHIGSTQHRPWWHVTKTNFQQHHRHDLVMTWITWRLLAPKVTNNGQDTTMDSTWTTPGQCFM